MSETRESKRIKLDQEAKDDSDSSIVPTRRLDHYMSHKYNLLDNGQPVEKYIGYIEDSDTTQLLDDFILKYRINNILTCRHSRRNTASVEALWYTTTCYLSGKIIILFFTMSRLFSVNIGEITSKTELTELWLIVEKMMWEIMTTNSIQIMSDPPSLEMLGQTTGSRLGTFIESITDEVDRRDIHNGLSYITSVSRGELDRSVIIEDIYSLLTRDYRVPKIGCDFIDSIIPIIAGISTSGGIIHWFSFVINSETGRIYVYSSWADGDYPIQSIMTKVEVNITEFNDMINILTNGSVNAHVIQQTISTIQKYFFSNPPAGSEDVIDYLNSVFLTEGSIIGGKFQIIMFPAYYKHCINISNLLLQNSVKNQQIKSYMSALVATSKKLYIDIEFVKFKLLLITLYKKMGCVRSGFLQTKKTKEESGVRGGKMKQKRSMKKRKTIKRKRRYTRRYKKRIL